ncbi:olfactory receptor 10A7-like [Gastrophryne carolinensis]
MKLERYWRNDPRGWTTLTSNAFQPLRHSGNLVSNVCVYQYHSPLHMTHMTHLQGSSMSRASYENNITTILFLGFHTIGKLNFLLFSFLIIIYFVTVCVNSLIIVLVGGSKILHTPMYFFLTQLSTADIMLTTNIVPNMLKILFHGRTSMTFSGCITQFFYFGFSEMSECFLLLAMSYDRYLAICSPLHYVSIMNRVLCVTLVLLSWLLSACAALILTLGVCQLHFCGPNTIDHFFCDFHPLLELSCSDTSKVEMRATLVCIAVVVIPFCIIVVSYTYIVVAILKISSSSGRMKSFSTCSSHLTVVFIFYGTLTAMYMLPNEGQSLAMSKTLAMLYTVFTPFLNPLIYSLRNKDIKGALNNFVYRGKLFKALEEN